MVDRRVEVDRVAVVALDELVEGRLGQPVAGVVAVGVSDRPHLLGDESSGCGGVSR